MMVITIPQTSSDYVEKLFFEYNATMNILKYLTTQEGVKPEYIAQYTEDAKNKYAELEIAKREISNEYSPYPDKKFNYTFDFDHSAIIYEEQI